MQPETHSRLAILRQKAIEGTLNLDEVKEAVKLMRADRMSAATAPSTARKAKAKAVIKDADEMLDELGGI